MFRCSIFAIFGLLLPLSAQTTAERAGSDHSASAAQKKDRRRCSTSAADDLMTSLAPRPYVYVAPSLMPAGYAIGAIRAEGGLNVESCHLVASGGAAYDNGRAANDNGPPNPKGHDRYLDGKIDSVRIDGSLMESSSELAGDGANIPRRTTLRAAIARNLVADMT